MPHAGCRVPHLAEKKKETTGFLFPLSDASFELHRGAVSRRGQVEVHDLLGMKLSYNQAEKKATLDQITAIDALLQKAGMADCNGEATPLPVKPVFTKGDCPQDDNAKDDFKEQATLYRSLVASCIYLCGLAPTSALPFPNCASSCRIRARSTSSL